MMMTETTTGTEPRRHGEGSVARVIEDQTARLPSDTFLWGALAAMAGALALQVTDRRLASLFVGQWVPTILVFGLYNKLVKVAGSDRTSPR